MGAADFSGLVNKEVKIWESSGVEYYYAEVVGAYVDNGNLFLIIIPERNKDKKRIFRLIKFSEYSVSPG